MFGLIPGIQQAETVSRQAFCATTAVSFMALAPRMDRESLALTSAQFRARRVALHRVQSLPEACAQRVDIQREVEGLSEICTKFGAGINTSNARIVGQ